MNLLIVDDHAIVREGYKSLIKAMFKGSEVYEADSGKSTLEILDKYPIEIVVLDINLAHESGLIVGKQILKKDVNLKVIFFSMFEDGAILHRAIELGAMGYISKQSDPEVLISAIEFVQRGQKYIQQDLAVKLARQLLSDQLDIEARLTSREFEIFIAFAMKKNRQETADELGISTKTISNTLTTIKRKLEVEVSEFNSLAVQHGYIGST